MPARPPSATTSRRARTSESQRSPGRACWSRSRRSRSLTSEEARALALALPNAVEQDHHGRPSFRVGGKIFATLWDEDHMNVMLDEGGILMAVQERPEACNEVMWGKRLAAVRVDLGAAEPAWFGRLFGRRGSYTRRSACFSRSRSRAGRTACRSAEPRRSTVGGPSLRAGRARARRRRSRPCPSPRTL